MNCNQTTEKMNSDKKLYHFVVQDLDELSEMFNFEIRDELPSAVVEIIESNLDNNLDIIRSISIHVNDLNTSLNIFVQRNQFLFLLEEQLQVFESTEKYEMCARIMKIIQKLKAGSVVESIKQFKTEKLK